MEGQLEDMENIEFNCTEVREISGMPEEQMVSEISKLLSSGEYQRVNLLLQKKTVSLDENLDESAVSFVVSNEGKMKLEGTHLSMLISGMSRYNGNFKTSDGMDKNRNKRFSKQLVNASYTAFYQYNKGSYSDAIAILENAKYDELPQQEKASFSLLFGNCYFKLKDYHKAVQCYTFEEHKEPQKQKAQRLNNLGACYSKLKKYEKGLRCYTDAIEIYAKYPSFDRSNLLNNIGTLYMAVEMYKNAVKYFSESIELRKTQNKYANTLTTSYTKMAICLRFDERYEQAIENLLIAQNCAERDESSMEPIFKELALSSEKLKRWSDALEFYQKLSNVIKNQGYILERVSMIHKTLGHNHEFEKFLKQSLSEYRKEGNERKISQLLNLHRTITHPMSSEVF